MARKPSKFFNCEYCGKPKKFQAAVYEWKLKHGRRFFCSHECSNKFHVGKNNPFFGKNHTEKTKSVLRDKLSGENNPRYGKKNSDEHNAAISKANKGKKQPPITEKTRELLRKAKSGENNPMYGKEPWNKGKPLPSWVRGIISRGNKKAFEDPEVHAKYCGENNVFWRGGVKDRPYGSRF